MKKKAAAQQQRECAVPESLLAESMRQQCSGRSLSSRSRILFCKKNPSLPQMRSTKKQEIKERRQRRSRKKNAHHSNVKAATYKITRYAVAAAHQTHTNTTTPATQEIHSHAASLWPRAHSQSANRTHPLGWYTLNVHRALWVFFHFAVLLGDSWQHVRVPDTTVLATSKVATDLDRLWVWDGEPDLSSRDTVASQAVRKTAGRVRSDGIEATVERGRSIVTLILSNSDT
jgi:hypothetical protein